MENREYFQGQLLRATVKGFKSGDIILDVGDNQEAILRKSQQIRGQVFNPGDRTAVAVEPPTRPALPIGVSRTSTELLKRLIEIEVPEILSGTVVVKALTREPGEKAKIAVTGGGDPVRTCCGANGLRLQPVTKELCGETIDVVLWSENPLDFVRRALAPAKIEQAQVIDTENRRIEVIVADDQLSIALGKKGTNIRLASSLTGWKIDLKSSSED